MVMPCSRSASSPSTSSARSTSSPVVPWRRLARVTASMLVLEDHLGLVEQASDQGRLAVVDRAAGEEAQQAATAAGLGRHQK
jgi:hypothetical protein